MLQKGSVCLPRSYHSLSSGALFWCHILVRSISGKKFPVWLGLSHELQRTTLIFRKNWTIECTILLRRVKTNIICFAFSYGCFWCPKVGLNLLTTITLMQGINEGVLSVKETCPKWKPHRNATSTALTFSGLRHSHKKATVLFMLSFYTFVFSVFWCEEEFLARPRSEAIFLKVAKVIRVYGADAVSEFVRVHLQRRQE